MEALAKSNHRTPQLRYVIDDESKVGEARRAAQALANFEFDAQTAGKVAIVTTELAKNVLRHAGGGEVLVQVLGSENSSVVEILALDRGPGMSDVARCMADGYSTAGTPGTGLGAVRRLADTFDIYSLPGEGTAVMARFGAEPKVRYGAISVAMPGEIDCGDAWRLESDGTHIAIIMIDGLGHGTFASQAAQAGVSAFAATPFAAPLEIMSLAGTAMARTRGGAAACALIRADELRYSGVGNISGTLVSAEKSQGLVSHSGTLGMAGRKPQELVYARPPGSLLILHSDGLSARWNLRERPELMTRHPAVIAATLYRDQGRNRDDATVLVLA